MDSDTWKRQARIFKVRQRQFLRALRNITRIFIPLKNRRMLLFGIGSSVVSVATISFWTFSVRAEQYSQLRMLMRIRQQSVMKQLKTNDADYGQKLQSLGILDPLQTFSAASLDKLFRKLQIDHHIADFHYSITHNSAVPNNPDLFVVALMLDMKSNRDRNITGFWKQFTARIPGIVVFEHFQIEREGKILSHSEFAELLKAKGRNKKIPPAFSAKMQCKVVVLKESARQFASLRS
ncbi:MAG: hypothetical protein LBJ89_02395 [Holosporales bacterium]|jgi:hypothetical protein|nr:hypothetical protein [Holosporales bacterium]